MGHVIRRLCCNTFPGMHHSRICEARRARGDMPTIQVVRCTNAACRVLSFDGAAEGVVKNLPCPGCSHFGDVVRAGGGEDK